MPSPKALTSAPWAAAEKHLARDPVLRRVTKRVGPCTLAPRRDYFVVLCKAIFSQQLSTKVADVLFSRFRDLFPSRRPTPSSVLRIIDTPTTLKACGLSRSKQKYIKDLAHHFHTSEIPTRRLSSMSDDEVIEALVNVNGIGRWTAEMFLIFTLNRPDVLPIDDLGLRKGFQVAFNLPALPTAAEMNALAEKWRPWRTIATWYLWRGLSKPAIPINAKRN
jgi:DNA-3-methyladenine glycosylase II